MYHIKQVNQKEYICKMRKVYTFEYINLLEINRPLSNIGKSV